MPKGRPQDQDTSENLTSIRDHMRPLHSEHSSSDAAKRGRKRKTYILDDGLPHFSSGRKRLKKSKSLEKLRKSKRASVVAKRNSGNAPTSQSDALHTRTRRDPTTNRPKEPKSANSQPAKLSFPPPELSPPAVLELTSIPKRTPEQLKPKSRKSEAPKITIHADTTRYSYAALLDLYRSEEAKRTLRQRQLNDRLAHPGNVSDVENWSPNRDAAPGVQGEQYMNIQAQASRHSLAMAGLTPAPSTRKLPSLTNVALQILRRMR